MTDDELHQELTISIIEEQNRSLEREAAAYSAVQRVMNQLSALHPSRLSIWTTREIARLLDKLYYEYDGQITLGNQHMSGGFNALPSNIHGVRVQARSGENFPDSQRSEEARSVPSAGETEPGPKP